MRHLRRSGPLTTTRFLTMTSTAVLIAASVTMAAPAFADDATAQKWIDSEFQPSTLSKADQLKELQWFEKAAQPFKGMEINVVSETITTHEYESQDPGQGVHRNHRHQAQARHHPGRRRRREAADPDAVRQERL